jgi:hypothetical protein
VLRRSLSQALRGAGIFKRNSSNRLQISAARSCLYRQWWALKNLWTRTALKIRTGIERRAASDATIF